MSIRKQQRSPCLRRTGVIGLVILGSFAGGAAGCLAPAPVDAPARQPGSGVETPPVLPPGAVQIGPDLYEVPIGVDPDGCRTYRLYSPTLLVSQAISYRRPDGSLTIDKREAACHRGASTGRAPGTDPGDTTALLRGAGDPTERRVALTSDS